MITISTELAAAIAQWASSTDERLGVVVFRDSKVIATDQRRIVIVPCETHGITLGIQRAHLLAAVAAQDVLARDGWPSAIRHDIDDEGDLLANARGSRELRIDLQDGLARIFISPDVTALSCRPFNLDAWPYDAIQKIAAAATEVPSTTPDAYHIDPRYLHAVDQVHRAMYATVAGHDYGVRCVTWPDGPPENNGRPFAFVNHHGATFIVMPIKTPPEAS